MLTRFYLVAFLLFRFFSNAYTCVWVPLSECLYSNPILPRPPDDHLTRRLNLRPPLLARSLTPATTGWRSAQNILSHKPGQQARRHAKKGTQTLWLHTEFNHKFRWQTSPRLSARLPVGQFVCSPVFCCGRETEVEAEFDSGTETETEAELQLQVATRKRAEQLAHWTLGARTAIRSRLLEAGAQTGGERAFVRPPARLLVCLRENEQQSCAEPSG